MALLGHLQQKVQARLSSLARQTLQASPTLRDRLGKYFPEANSLVDAGKTTVWDDSASHFIKDGFKVYWETLEAVGRYQSQCITGREDGELFAYMIGCAREHVGKSNLRGLCIGCSELGRPEITFLQSGIFQSFDVMDIADGLLQRQQEKAAGEGLPVRYIYQDLNKVRFAPDSYDFVYALGTVHHIAEMESFFVELNRGLSPRGIFAMREYVGANRLQFTDSQLELAAAILSLIPPEYRRTLEGDLKQREWRTDVNELLRIDPSEAVRSEDIIPIMQREMDVFYLANTGGGMLNLVLHRIAGHFERDPRGRELLAGLIRMDRELFESGFLKSDYMFSLARKKTAAPAPA